MNGLTPFASFKLFNNTVKQICVYGVEIWGNFDKEKTLCPTVTFWGHKIGQIDKNVHRYLWGHKVGRSNL